MASARKKQDEKNLKIVRELVSQPPNKFCFDCGQRGPTYVNVTIGSFVCTKCSGLLRGLTPPHRVKSISMTTFTADEVDQMRLRGNDYCRMVWLGLYDGKVGAEVSAANARWDEHAVHQLMLDKYERKRFYMEPTTAMLVTAQNNQINNKVYSDNTQSQTTTAAATIKPPPVLPGGAAISRNGFSHSRNKPSSNGNNGAEFVADFDHADIFSSSSSNNNAMTNGYTNGSAVTQAQNHFADFDNNPAFSNSSNASSLDDFSIFDLQFSVNWGPMWNETPIFPKVNLNKSSFPGFTNNTPTNSSVHARPPAPTLPAPVSEDKYAALRDLDGPLHAPGPAAAAAGAATSAAPPALDWGGSSSSLYSSATSPLSSSYGSPTTSSVFNPFNTNGCAPGAGDIWSQHNMPFDGAPVKPPQHMQPQQHLNNNNNNNLLFPSVNGHTHNPSLFSNGSGNIASASVIPNPFGGGGFVAAFPPMGAHASVANGASNNGPSPVTWNHQNPFKLATNGNPNNPFL